MINDWLKAVPDVAWAAIVTGVFLTVQNILNNRREDRRKALEAVDRQADRELQLQLAEQARADARSEAWREERQSAHSALLAELRRVERAISGRLIQITNEGRYWGPTEGTYTDLIEEADRHALDELFARVEIVGSENAKSSAAKLARCIATMVIRFWALTEIYDIDDPSHEERRTKAAAQLRAERARWTGLLEAYVHDVRADLGTAED